METQCLMHVGNKYWVNVENINKYSDLTDASVHDLYRMIHLLR